VCKGAFDQQVGAYMVEVRSLTQYDQRQCDACAPHLELNNTPCYANQCFSRLTRPPKLSWSPRRFYEAYN
jgi:hypothetical protein